ncbi:hypothetical protein CHS0354_006856 [Potamilus streckersoni]|uniref:Large ribosomal subunit protein bL9m n=1 Tax=Potamilus streckersoni TaxID=2493646 RepID=A0AAE0TF74_9BIVA|nr:hypothetical protein CHS0354_006856 [Potamilus streckersoni]
MLTESIKRARNIALISFDHGYIGPDDKPFSQFILTTPAYPMTLKQMTKSLQKTRHLDMGRIGSLGDEVTVKPGFGRNYLIPQGLAVQITRENASFIRQQRQYLATNLKETPLSLPCLRKKTCADVVGRGYKNWGIEVDKKNFQLGATIKQVGTHKVPVKLHSEVTVNVTVIVAAEKTAEQLTEKTVKPAETPSDTRGSPQLNPAYRKTANPLK